MSDLKLINHEGWNLLKTLNHSFSLPWLCARDFSEILKSHEKFGGRLRLEKQMQDYRDTLDVCGYTDLGFIGNKFTWCKRLTG